MKTIKKTQGFPKTWIYTLCYALGVIVLFLVVFSCEGDASKGRKVSEYDRSYSVDELQADFKQFRYFLEGSHPQLYRYTTRRTFDSLFNDHYRRLKYPMTTREFYEILIPLIARVGCGHTSLWAPEGFWDRAPQQMFPLRLHVREDQLFAIHSYGQESAVSPGSRITSINGVPSDSILTKILNNIWSDGFIKSKRIQRLNAVFPYLYALHYGFPEEFLVGFQKERDLIEASLLPVSKVWVDASIDSLYAPGGSRSPELHLSLLEKQTALLRIGSFAYYDDNKGFNSFIDSSFRVIRDRHIQHLVIDLRGNDGGDPFCSSHLLSYLQREPVIYFREPYGQYARLSQPLPMAELPFAGEQYYLINGLCFSTTGHFASLLKYHNLGTFIGEETGGTFTCNDASHDLILRHTGYRVQSARRSFSAAAYGFPANRGILPDHHVQASIKEQIWHKDAVLEYTLKLIGAL